MVETLQEEGYSFLSVAHHNYAGLIKLYAAIPDIINTIWASETVILSCMSDPFCRADFPRAQAHALGMADVRGVIPSWKMMAVSYWGAHPTSWEYGQREGDGFAFNPLGHEWALVPYPYPGHTHIPMSLEKQCTATPFIPHHNRKDTAVILGKLTPYFFPNRSGDLPPSLEAWQGFLRETGLQAIGNAKPLFPGVEGEPQSTPEGVLNRGPVGRDEFTEEVGKARMMIGIGMPAISPSPYLALCQGVPALIPYDGNDPTPPGFERYSLGRTQHGPAASLGEPYVYSYNRHDVQSLYAAARKARANPIKPFIPDEMRHAHVARLTLQAVNRDYHALAREIERQRLHKGGEDAVYAAIPDHVRETVFGHGWGMRMMRDGTVGKTL
ncbi:hypothetical protein QFC21_006362 [Naganishia friedmannii]|uniref:Uncharacterized protein n=1 Tax=Naganishia friedmannii TaxID=89922 RepID=A0ACC2V357_9TREE|nr:hypothetical protein QFC21_006362 [Naganishia friedmannii]